MDTGPRDFVEAVRPVDQPGLERFRDGAPSHRCRPSGDEHSAGVAEAGNGQPYEDLQYLGCVERGTQLLARVEDKCQTFACGFRRVRTSLGVQSEHNNRRAPQYASWRASANRNQVAPAKNAVTKTSGALYSTEFSFEA